MMLILDGGLDADLPKGPDSPILAGREAILVGGRVPSDAPTRIRFGRPGEHGRLVKAYVGSLATPELLLRVVNAGGDVLAEIAVTDFETPLEIYVTDFVEPDEIFVAIEAQHAPDLVNTAI